MGHVSSERGVEAPPDRILIGILKLVQKVLVCQPELRRRVLSARPDLPIELFRSCLFAIPDPKDSTAPAKTSPQIKCKTEPSRTEAFALILALCAGETQVIHALTTKAIGALILGF